MGNLAKLAVAIVMLLAPASASAAAFILNFEGLRNLEPVMNFYNGGKGGNGSGPGNNYGITFSPDALAIIDADAGGSGNFGGEPSPSTTMFFLNNTPILNASAGFTKGFSFYYSSIINTGRVKVYDGLNASGNVLASRFLPSTPFNGAPDPTGFFSPLVPIGVSFSGTARSIGFEGVANQIGFDDITFGSANLPKIPPKDTTAPGTLTLTGTENFHPEKSTVVITHGWRGCSAEDSESCWEGKMAGKIRNLKPDDQDVNVIEAYWEGAKTAFSAKGLHEATAKVVNEGKRLAEKLKELGVSAISKGLQFIGHSLGSLVNAYAANVLTTKEDVQVDQFTILDRPFGDGIQPENILDTVGEDADQQIFRTLLPKGKVTWVDNYYGDSLTATGASFEGKALAFNELYAGAGHSEVHDRYDATIALTSPCTDSGGFGCSVVLGNFDKRPKAQFWDPLASLLRPAGDILTINLNDWLTFNCEINDSENKAQCSEGSPAYLWIPDFTIDPDGQFLSFDLQWTNPGDGDWLELFFDDTLLFSFTGNALDVLDVFNAGLIPIFDLAGKTGQLLFRLNSVGESNAEFEISNIQIFSADAVPEPGTLLLLGTGLLGLVRLRFALARLRRGKSVCGGNWRRRGGWLYQAS